MRAIFAVDGGNATGLAWGIFDDQAGSVEAALASNHASGSMTINHRVRRNGKMMVVNPHDDYQQIVKIATQFLAFRREAIANGCSVADEIELVVEDFILMPGAHAGGKDGVASVRIAWGLAGYLLDEHQVIWQAPSLMSYATDERLKRWGIWVPGRDHERAAWKHIAARLNKIIR
jgi:hypothetical protein